LNPFANSILILGTLAQLTLIASAAEEQPLFLYLDKLHVLDQMA
jgi:hypothetical protein